MKKYFYFACVEDSDDGLCSLSMSDDVTSNNATKKIGTNGNDWDLDTLDGTKDLRCIIYGQ